MEMKEKKIEEGGEGVKRGMLCPVHKHLWEQLRESSKSEINLLCHPLLKCFTIYSIIFFCERQHHFHVLTVKDQSEGMNTWIKSEQNRQGETTNIFNTYFPREIYSCVYLSAPYTHTKCFFFIANKNKTHKSHKQKPKRTNMIKYEMCTSKYSRVVIQFFPTGWPKYVQSNCNSQGTRQRKEHDQRQTWNWLVKSSMDGFVETTILWFGFRSFQPSQSWSQWHSTRYWVPG